MSDKIRSLQPPGFRSLVELQDAHDQLLDRRDQLADSELGTPEFWQEVSEFAKNTQATGVWLDASRDRRAGQSILDYWTNALFRAGQAIPAERLAEFDPHLAPELPDTPCPYQGLAAFDEGRGSFYFGRETLVAEMIRRLANGARLLAITGASGSGKSSVVLAGLLPALRAGALAGSQGWRYIVMVPGSNPVANLEYALRAVEDGLLCAPLMLVVDQFEEAFTLCQDETLTAEFVARLLRLLDSDQSDQPPATITLTMRSDFVDRVAKAPELWTRFRAVRLEVEALDINELRAAIEGPAATVGLKFEEGIVDDLISTILGERAGLPLLQFTLLRLWEKRQRNRVTYAVYQQVGSPRQALERSAEEFYTGLFPEEQVTVRRILLKMVRPGPGLEVTSNRIRRSELFHNAEAHDRVEHVLDRLINDARLVKLSMRESSEDEQVEVAHEALIRNWPRLVQWLDEEREELRQRFLLAEAARQWEQQGRPTDGLWRGRLLDEAHDFADLSDLERGFLTASDEQVRLEREQEIAQQVELGRAQASAQFQEQQSRRKSKTIRRLVVVIVLLLILPVFWGIREVQRYFSPWQPISTVASDYLATLAAAPGGTIDGAALFCVGSWNIGVGCSKDGMSWNIYQQGLPTGLRYPFGIGRFEGSVHPVYRLAIDPNNINRLFAYILISDFGQVYSSENGGIDWASVNLKLPSNDPAQTIQVLDNWVFLATRTSHQLYASDDSGKHWAQISGVEGSSLNEVSDVQIADNQNFVYAAGETGLSRAKLIDAQSPQSHILTWEKVVDLAEIRFIDEVAGTGRFYLLAADQNANQFILHTWQAVDDGEPASAPQQLAVIRGTPRALTSSLQIDGSTTAYILLTNNEVLEVDENGQVNSLGRRPAWPFGVAHDLLAVPNQTGDAARLWLAHTDGLLEYQR